MSWYKIDHVYVLVQNEIFYVYYLSFFFIY